MKDSSLVYLKNHPSGSNPEPDDSASRSSEGVGSRPGRSNERRLSCTAGGGAG